MLAPTAAAFAKKLGGRAARASRVRRGGRTVEQSKERVGGVGEEDLEEEEEEVFMWVRMLEVIARRVLGEG